MAWFESEVQTIYRAYPSSFMGFTIKIHPSQFGAKTHSHNVTPIKINVVDLKLWNDDAHAADPT